jgi:hypothetical protein
VPHEPPDGVAPVNRPERVSVPAGSRATVKFEPEQSGSTFRVPVLAVTKRADTTYQVNADGTTTYPQAPIPPTDIDDTAQVFYPPFGFTDSCSVIIRNVGTNERTYTVQLIGWEAEEGAHGA